MYFGADSSHELRTIYAEITQTQGQTPTLILNVKGEDAAYGVHMQMSPDEGRALLAVLSKVLEPDHRGDVVWYVEDEEIRCGPGRPVPDDSIPF